MHVAGIFGPWGKQKLCVVQVLTLMHVRGFSFFQAIANLLCMYIVASNRTKNPLKSD